jgi:Zn-finger nucleic acid-binding protein
MKKIQFKTIAVDRCKHCAGLWFDALEVDWLRAEEGSEVIDAGDPAIGAQHNRIDMVNCPVCNAPMVRMVDSRQPHIWYEKCSICAGTYFDAGEFKDLKEFTTEDLIKSLFSAGRPY